MAEESSRVVPYNPVVQRRIVFIYWRHINPGWFQWVDEEGRARDLRESWDPAALHFQPIEQPYGVRLAAQPAQRVGPLFTAQHPWEQMGVGIQTVLYDGGVYRAWAACNPELMMNVLCYLESKDGYTWERPSLGMFEFQGSRNNNVLFAQGWNRHIFTDPNAPSSERYKMVIGDRKGVCGAVSPDGLHWTELSNPILQDHSDTQNIGYYDESLGRYVVYNRKNLSDGRRGIGRTESVDFRHFSVGDLILEATPEAMLPSADLYTNCRTTIPGAPDHHLMFPTVYHRDTDIGSLALASSADGRLWHFLQGSPMLTATPFGQWDCGWLTACPHLIELPDGAFALPYVAGNLPHKYPRGQLRYNTGYALWPKGRIVALEAVERGEFTTNPIATTARTLRINAVTQRAGSIRVEVVNVAGRSFAEATPVVGDHHWTPVTWQDQADLGHREGEPIVLRFRMDRAQLFGLEFV